jgi:hypothetical protein
VNLIFFLFRFGWWHDQAVYCPRLYNSSSLMQWYNLIMCVLKKDIIDDALLIIQAYGDGSPYGQSGSRYGIHRHKGGYKV